MLCCGSITEVAQTLAGMPALEYVDLGYNELEGAFDSACGLAATKKLEELSLMNNALSGAHARPWHASAEGSKNRPLQWIRACA